MESFNLKINKKYLKKFKKLIEALEERSIPNILKNMSIIIKNDILNSGTNFNKIYKEIEPYNINVKLNFNSDKYYSNIDLYKILKMQLLNIEIVVNIPVKYDIDYVVAVIIHEIRHIYDILTVNYDHDMNSFVKSFFIDKFRQEEYKNFINLIYVSLEHELVARNNMIFPYVGLKNISKDESISIVKNCFIYTSLIDLSNFNHINFIKSIDLNKLIELTNLFIKDIDKNNKEVNNLNDVTIFYKKWEDYFKNISVEWQIELNKEINKIYESKNPIKDREMNINEYHEDMKGSAKRLFQKIYKKVIG